MTSVRRYRERIAEGPLSHRLDRRPFRWGGAPGMQVHFPLCPGLRYSDGGESGWDPYTRTGADINDRVAIDWGVYGVPETFVIDRQGRIAYKQIGPLNPEVLEKMILPLIRKLRQ